MIEGTELPAHHGTHSPDTTTRRRPAPPRHTGGGRAYHSRGVERRPVVRLTAPLWVTPARRPSPSWWTPTCSGSSRWSSARRLPTSTRPAASTAPSASAAGRRRGGWAFDVDAVEGRDPLGDQDPTRFAPLDAELAAALSRSARQQLPVRLGARGADLRPSVRARSVRPAHRLPPPAGTPGRARLARRGPGPGPVHPGRGRSPATGDDRPPLPADRRGADACWPCSGSSPAAGVRPGPAGSAGHRTRRRLPGPSGR